MTIIKMGAPVIKLIIASKLPYQKSEITCGLHYKTFYRRDGYRIVNT